MDDTYITTVFVIFDELCRTLLPASRHRPEMTLAEILTAAVAAACSFGNHLETVDLSKGAALYGNKVYNDATGERFLLDDGGVRLVPIRKKNMKPHDWADEYDLCLYRKRIETVNSQLESMGLERLKARTHRGFDIKVHALLIALWHTQTMAN